MWNITILGDNVWKYCNAIVLHKTETQNAFCKTYFNFDRIRMLVDYNKLLVLEYLNFKR